jgi:DNA end-binding protein Ku
VIDRGKLLFNGYPEDLIDQVEDEYRKTLEKAIAAKIAGKEIAVAPAAPSEKVVDLVEALKASLEATKKEGKEKRKPRKKVATGKS